MEGNLRKITKSDFLQHNGENGNDLWVLVHGKVINMAGFKHPGGSQVLTDDHDEDKGDEFDSIHSPAAINEMKNRVIGVLVDDEKPVDVKTHKKTDGDKVEEKSRDNTFMIFIPIFIVLGIVYWFYSK
jgi:cytochrome b involved in lipid metabolism